MLVGAVEHIENKRLFIFCNACAVVFNADHNIVVSYFQGGMYIRFGLVVIVVFYGVGNKVGKNICQAAFISENGLPACIVFYSKAKLAGLAQETQLVVNF